MSRTTGLADDPQVIEQILEHIDNRTTDLGDSVWREPVENYLSPERFAAEHEVLRASPTPFCPSAALPKTGSYLARSAAGTPLVAVRASDGKAQVFRNSCRHRGTQLAAGSGCSRSFVCRYHGWTYGLDGELRHVPHEHGFPDLDKSTRGLVPVPTAELHGMVFVTQARPQPVDRELERLSPLVPPGHRLVATNEREVPANWKILVEGFLEGYHIRSTHPDTFYPLQYDNLNVVEMFGRHRRIAFPYQAVNRMRKVDPEERSADGTLTYVYHLFPNVMVATFPGRIFMVVLEPLAIDRTRLITYMLTDHAEGDGGAREALESATKLVDAGAAEDREVACAIQRSLASGANEFFEFGLFEGLIGHFHRTLDAAIETGP